MYQGEPEIAYMFSVTLGSIGLILNPTEYTTELRTG